MLTVQMSADPVRSQGVSDRVSHVRLAHPTIKHSQGAPDRVHAEVERYERDCRGQQSGHVIQKGVAHHPSHESD